jgi:hypothetical protein
MHTISIGDILKLATIMNSEVAKLRLVDPEQSTLANEIVPRLRLLLRLLALLMLLLCEHGQHSWLPMTHDIRLVGLPFPHTVVPLHLEGTIRSASVTLVIAGAWVGGSGAFGVCLMWMRGRTSVTA